MWVCELRTIRRDPMDAQCSCGSNLFVMCAHQHVTILWTGLHVHIKVSGFTWPQECILFVCQQQLSSKLQENFCNFNSHTCKLHNITCTWLLCWDSQQKHQHYTHSDRCVQSLCIPIPGACTRCTKSIFYFGVTSSTTDLNLFAFSTLPRLKSIVVSLTSLSAPSSEAKVRFVMTMEGFFICTVNCGRNYQICSLLQHDNSLSFWSLSEPSRGIAWAKAQDAHRVELDAFVYPTIHQDSAWFGCKDNVCRRHWASTVCFRLLAHCQCSTAAIIPCSLMAKACSV